MKTRPFLPDLRLRCPFCDGTRVAEQPETGLKRLRRLFDPRRTYHCELCGWTFVSRLGYLTTRTAKAHFLLAATAASLFVLPGAEQAVRDVFLAPRPVVAARWQVRMPVSPLVLNERAVTAPSIAALAGADDSSRRMGFAQPAQAANEPQVMPVGPVYHSALEKLAAGVPLNSED